MFERLRLILRPHTPIRDLLMEMATGFYYRRRPALEHARRVFAVELLRGVAKGCERAADLREARLEEDMSHHAEVRRARRKARLVRQQGHHLIRAIELDHRRVRVMRAHAAASAGEHPSGHAAPAGEADPS